MNKLPRQFLVEIPEHTLKWPFPWLPDHVRAYLSLNDDLLNEIEAGYEEHQSEQIEVGDFLYTDGGEINFTNEVYDSEGNPTTYDENKKYAVYDEVTSEGDGCYGLAFEEVTSAFRPVGI